MPLAFTDAGCLSGALATCPLRCAVQGTRFCSPTTMPYSHSAPPAILCLSFPRLLSESSCGHAGGHHVPSAPAATQQILSRHWWDWAMLLRTSANPTAWGGPGSPPCWWSQSPSQVSWRPGRSRGSMPKQGRVWELCPFPASTPLPQQWGQSEPWRLGELVPALKNGRQSGSAAAGSSHPHCF